MPIPFSPTGDVGPVHTRVAMGHREALFADTGPRGAIMGGIRLPEELIRRLVRHGITPNAGMYELMDEVQKRGWAFEL